VKRRKTLIIGGTVLGLALVAGAILAFAFWDRATPVQEEDVAATLDVAVVGEEPGDFGLYVFETTGFETTDALGGARHDYPAETFLTLQPGGCGTLVRWQALEQRWSEWDHCEDLSLAGWQSYHEWFGVGNHDVWSCPEPVATAGPVGDSWEAECAKETGAERIRYEVIGREVLTIGGEEIETLHVRRTDENTGTTLGSGVTDIWTLPGTPLIVQRTVDSTTITESRIGPVEHHEEYTIRLLSVYPRS
jgi:hypothetical protein